MYQPKLPNDIGLLKMWKTKLKELNVDFLFNTEILNFNPNGDKIKSISVKNNNGNSDQDCQCDVFENHISPFETSDSSTCYTANAPEIRLTLSDPNTYFSDIFSVLFVGVVL